METVNDAPCGLKPMVSAGRAQRTACVETSARGLCLVMAVGDVVVDVDVDGDVEGAMGSKVSRILQVCQRLEEQGPVTHLKIHEHCPYQGTSTLAKRLRGDELTRLKIHKPKNKLNYN